jgi:L,D-transpeptidase YcbB
MKHAGRTLLLFLVLVLVSCKKHEVQHPYADITYEYYDTLRTAQFAINRQQVKWYIDSMRIAAHDTAFIDIFADRYYADESPYIWIDTKGADKRLDTLSAALATVDSDAISRTVVFQPQIERALKRLRDFNFTRTYSISRCLAEIEYYSTKGLLRMASGLRFGFINPYKMMNRIDLTDADDTLCTTFRTLYDTPTETTGKEYLSSIILSASKGNFMRDISAAKQHNKNYMRLREEFSRHNLSPGKRRVLAANMERFRWRTGSMEKKHVWVNLPEFMLRAVDSASGETLEMKVCEGSIKHKTPQLASKIQYLELNPAWNVPHSIISREIAPKIADGDEEYFERNKMKIIEKTTGEEIEPSAVDAQMLKSGKYSVVQNKGEGNSLGRMIFRFKNNFSIFLHDTPNRTAFSRPNRAVSHGCIRLEEPLALAAFLLGEKDEFNIDKMRIAVDIPPKTEKGKRLLENKNHKPAGSRAIKPAVPLYITYFTAYPDSRGNIVYTADPYGYDNKIISLLGSY